MHNHTFGKRMQQQYRFGHVQRQFQFPCTRQGVSNRQWWYVARGYRHGASHPGWYRHHFQITLHHGLAGHTRATVRIQPHNPGTAIQLFVDVGIHSSKLKVLVIEFRVQCEHFQNETFVGIWCFSRNQKHLSIGSRSKREIK